MAKTATPAFPQKGGTDSVVLTLARTDLTSLATTGIGMLTQTSIEGLEYAHIGAVTRTTLPALTQVAMYKITSDNIPALLGAIQLSALTVTSITALSPTPFLNVDGTTLSNANPLRVGVGEKLGFSLGTAVAGGVVVNAQYNDYNQ